MEPVVEQPACPKCAWRPAPNRPMPSGCARCGLLVSRWEAFRAEGPVASPLLDGPWEACVEEWDDPAAHDRLRELAMTAGALPLLAGRYRARLDAKPEDEIAKAQLARLTLVAEATLRAQVREPEPASSRVVRAVTLIVAGMFASFFLWRLALALSRRG